MGGICQGREPAGKRLGLGRQAIGKAASLTGQTIANIKVHGMRTRGATVEVLAKVLGMSAGAWAFASDDSDSVDSVAHSLRTLGDTWQTKSGVR